MALKKCSKTRDSLTCLKYLGSIVMDDGSNEEILFRTAQASTALTMLENNAEGQGIFLNSKVRLLRTLVTSVLLCGCETWT